MVRSIKALRQLVNSLVDTLKSLFWALVRLGSIGAEEFLGVLRGLTVAHRVDVQKGRGLGQFRA